MESNNESGGAYPRPIQEYIIEKPLPESSGNPLEDMKRSGQARILYHSALGTFLPPEKKAAGLQKVEAWEKRYLRHLWQGSLAPGKKLADVDTPFLGFMNMKHLKMEQIKLLNI